MHFTQLNSSKPQRESSTYRGGEIKSYINGSNVHVAFAFEGANYENCLPLLVAN